MIAVLDNLALVEHEDAIRFLDGGEAVGDDEGGSARTCCVQRLLNEAFIFGIQGGRSLVQEQDGGISVERTRQSDALTLTAGQGLSTLCQDVIPATG